MNLKNTEIELLAHEVSDNINQTLEITKFSITAASTLLGFGLSGIANKGILSSLICLLPIPILIAAVEMIIDRRQNVMKKATFLRMFGGKNYVWELFLRGQREDFVINNKKGSSFTITLIRMIKAISFVSIIASVILLIATTIARGYYMGIWPLCQPSDPSKLLPLLGAAITFLSIVVVLILVLIFFKAKEPIINNAIMGGKAEQEMAVKWLTIEGNLKKENSNRLSDDND